MIGTWRLRFVHAVRQLWTHTYLVPVFEGYLALALCARCLEVVDTHLSCACV